MTTEPLNSHRTLPPWSCTSIAIFPHKSTYRWREFHAFRLPILHSKIPVPILQWKSSCAAQDLVIHFPPAHLGLPSRHGLHLHALCFPLSSNFRSSSWKLWYWGFSRRSFLPRSPLVTPRRNWKGAQILGLGRFEAAFVAAEIRWLSLNDGIWRHVGGSKLCSPYFSIDSPDILVSEKQYYV